MSKTRIQSLQRPAAKGKHQRSGQRRVIRENPPYGMAWGAKVWPGPTTAIPFAVWLFDTGLAAAGILAGEVRLNNVNGSAVTHVFVSKTVASGTDPTAGWVVNDPLRIYYRDDTTMWVEYKITAVSSQTGYFDYTVTYTANSGGFVTPADNTPLLLIERTASPGADPQQPDPLPPFDPGSTTIPNVQAYVDGLGDPADPAVQAEIQRLLDMERAGQNRSTLITWLDAKLGVV